MTYQAGSSLIDHARQICLGNVCINDRKNEGWCSLNLWHTGTALTVANLTDKQQVKQFENEVLMNGDWTNFLASPNLLINTPARRELLDLANQMVQTFILRNQVTNIAWNTLDLLDFNTALAVVNLKGPKSVENFEETALIGRLWSNVRFLNTSPFEVEPYVAPPNTSQYCPPQQNVNPLGVYPPNDAQAPPNHHVSNNGSNTTAPQESHPQNSQNFQNQVPPGSQIGNKVPYYPRHDTNQTQGQPEYYNTGYWEPRYYSDGRTYGKFEDFSRTWDQGDQTYGTFETGYSSFPKTSEPPVQQAPQQSVGFHTPPTDVISPRSAQEGNVGNVPANAPASNAQPANTKWRDVVVGKSKETEEKANVETNGTNNVSVVETENAPPANVTLDSAAESTVEADSTITVEKPSEKKEETSEKQDEVQPSDNSKPTTDVTAHTDPIQTTEKSTTVKQEIVKTEVTAANEAAEDKTHTEDVAEKEIISVAAVAQTPKKVATDKEAKQEIIETVETNVTTIHPERVMETSNVAEEPKISFAAAVQTPKKVAIDEQEKQEAVETAVAATHPEPLVNTAYNDEAVEKSKISFAATVQIPKKVVINKQGPNNGDSPTLARRGAQSGQRSSANSSRNRAHGTRKEQCFGDFLDFSSLGIGRKTKNQQQSSRQHRISSATVQTASTSGPQPPHPKEFDNEGFELVRHGAPPKITFIKRLLPEEKIVEEENVPEESSETVTDSAEEESQTGKPDSSKRKKSLKVDRTPLKVIIETDEDDVYLDKCISENQKIREEIALEQLAIKSHEEEDRRRKEEQEEEERKALGEIEINKPVEKPEPEEPQAPFEERLTEKIENLDLLVSQNSINGKIPASFCTAIEDVIKDFAERSKAGTYDMSMFVPMKKDRSCYIKKRDDKILMFLLRRYNFCKTINVYIASFTAHFYDCVVKNYVSAMGPTLFHLTQIRDQMEVARQEYILFKAFFAKIPGDVHHFLFKPNLPIG